MPDARAGKSDRPLLKVLSCQNSPGLLPRYYLLETYLALILCHFRQPSKGESPVEYGGCYALITLQEARQKT